MYSLEYDYELGVIPFAAVSAGVTQTGGIVAGVKKIFGGLFGKKKKKAGCYNPCTGEKVGDNTLGKGCNDDFPGMVRQQYIAERRAKIKCAGSEPLSPGGISWKELAALDNIPKGATYSPPVYRPSNGGGNGGFELIPSARADTVGRDTGNGGGGLGIDKNLLLYGGLALLAVMLLKGR